MKTTKTKSNVLVGLLLSAGMMMLSSCDDFLTITPTDRIVEEDFWDDRNDLEGALASCYMRMIQGDIMNKYIQWGEMRGDNFEKRNGATAINMNNLMNANLLSTNNIFSWTCFYNEINYCNKILAHGPEIVAIDESFSNGDWEPMRAEVVTLRALCHFYLVRTFGEIPYVTQDYNNDSQDFLIGQSTQIEVLNNIISDLEEVKDKAMINYGTTSENKGRITRKAVYSLLADVYLWRASYKQGNPDLEDDGPDALSDYNRCIECCDYVINNLLDEYKSNLKKSGGVLSTLSDDLTWEDLLITNVSNASLPILSTNTTGAYDAIFGKGNSSESIFELQFDGTQNSNSMLSLFWNTSDRIAGSMVCSSALISSVDQNPNSTIPGSIYTKTDYRRWETGKYAGANQTEWPMAKYNFSSISQYNTTSPSYGMRDNTNANYSTTATQIATMRGTNNDANWIVYRLSDVLLMKAEAMVQLGGEKDLWEAFWLTRAVFKRSNPYAYQNTTSVTDSLDYKVFNTQQGMNALVLCERQREFVGEGKRWFDLVRFAQRDGNTVQMLKYLTRKYTDNKKAIEAKLASLQSLFSPIYTNEIKNNNLLHQNEVWGTTESTSRTDDV